MRLVVSTAKHTFGEALQAILELLEGGSVIVQIIGYKAEKVESPEQAVLLLLDAYPVLAA